MAITLIPKIALSNGNVLFIYENGPATDTITISLNAGTSALTSYSNALNAQNQERHRWGTRLITYSINNNALFQKQIVDNFLYFNKAGASSTQGIDALYIGSRVLSYTTLQNRAEIIMQEKDMPGSTGIVDVINPVPDGADNFVIGQNIFQSYIGEKPKRRSRSYDIYSLMAEAAGDMYITITRTSNNIVDGDGNPLPLPYCLFGLNDFANGYQTLMQQQLAALNNSL